MGKGLRAPEVRVLREEDAHPLYLLSHRWKVLGMQLAAALAKDGRREQARALRLHINSAWYDLRDLPRTKGNT